jgi:predicted ribosome quality control (RQC) complex YloA/Tae2 family protein
MLIKFVEYQEYAYEIKIGESAQENWDMISAANQRDMWFHLSGLPSSHVILTVPQDFKLKKIPSKIIFDCAVHCKQHSKSKNINKVKVIYCPIKCVKKADAVGSVTTTGTKQLTV